MNTKELERRVAFLESLHDQLQTEKDYLNEILVRSGFPEGLESLRSVAEELLQDREGEA